MLTRVAADISQSNFRLFATSPFMKVIRRLVSLYLRMAWNLRWLWLNVQPGCQIVRTIYLSRSAQIQLHSDSFVSGGEVIIKTQAIISDGVILAPYGGSITLDEGCYIGPYCVLYGHGGLSIGKNTLIASQTTIIPSNHVFDDPCLLIKQQNHTTLGIQIGEDVWIGSGCRILDGVSIGKGCVIGAGAVVTRSLPDYAVAVGVPARIVKMRGTN